MVLASIDYELWRGQAQNGVNLAFQVKFDLEGQGQSPPKTIGTLTKLFCTFCPNLVVLAWKRRDLWRGQARGWRTHTQTDTHTDRQTQATTIPEGQNWPRVKNSKCKELILHSFIQQSCFTMILPLAVSSPNNVLICYDNQLPVVQQYFKNIAAIQNMGVLWQIWLYKILGVYYWYLKIPQCWYMEQGLKDDDNDNDNDNEKVFIVMKIHN